MVAEPVVVEAGVDPPDEAAGGAVEGLAGDEGLHRGIARGRGVHVEIERFLPVRDQKDGMFRLPEIFLRDLQFDGLIGLLQAAE